MTWGCLVCSEKVVITKSIYDKKIFFIRLHGIDMIIILIIIIIVITITKIIITITIIIIVVIIYIPDNTYRGPNIRKTHITTLSSRLHTNWCEVNMTMTCTTMTNKYIFLLFICVRIPCLMCLCVVVYLYGEAAGEDFRRSVPQIRAGEYEGLPEKV